MPPLKNGFVFTSPIRRKRDHGSGAMALTEYKVDRVRSRAASCNGLDRWIYNEILEGIENVVTLLIWLDDPHIRVSDAAQQCMGRIEKGGVRKPPMYEPAVADGIIVLVGRTERSQHRRKNGD